MDIGAWASEITKATLFSIPLVITMGAFLDAARRPRWAWALSAHTQVFWLAGLLFSTMTVVGGVIAAIWYALRVRPELVDIENGIFGD